MEWGRRRVAGRRDGPRFVPLCELQPELGIPSGYLHEFSDAFGMCNVGILHLGGATGLLFYICYCINSAFNATAMVEDIIQTYMPNAPKIYFT